MRLAKRLTDIVLSSVGLALVLPLLLLAGLAVWVTMGRPVVFRQERAGLHGAAFTVYKLRTMRDATGPDGQPLPDPERVTPVGRLLRRTRIDDMVQLSSVLSGHMSIVGPRPLPRRTIHAGGRVATERLAVKPGLTGWAQVSGNTLLTDREKFALDAWYVKHHSLLLDAIVVFRTPLVLVQGERRDERQIERALSCVSDSSAP